MGADELHVVHAGVVGTRRTQEAHQGDRTVVRRKRRRADLRDAYVRRAGTRSDRSDRSVEGSRRRRGGHGRDRGLLAGQASPWEALTEAGIEAQSAERASGQLRGRKTDVEDRRWFAPVRVEFESGRPSFIPPPAS